MRIKTNAGEIDYDFGNAANVKKGMLFRFSGRDVVAACDGQFSAASYEFLGSHPALATRADCERFGIPERCEQHGVRDAPLDAAAHGFARLRAGGAVDISDGGTPPGSVLDIEHEGQRVRSRPCGGVRVRLEKGERWIGLDTRDASPENVRRLCCGAEHLSNEQYDPHVCSLAISDHDHHEDLATGVRWAAKADAIPPFPCCACGGEVVGRWPAKIIAKGEHGENESGTLCTACSGKDWEEARFVSGRLVADPAKQPAVVLRVAGKDYPCAAIREPSTGAWKVRLRAGPEVYGRLSAGALVELVIAGDAESLYPSQSGYSYDPQVREGMWVDATLIAPATLDFSGDPTTKLLGEQWKQGAAEIRDLAGQLERLQKAQLAARDAAVAEAISEVPEGCDPKGWANAVRVIAADAVEGTIGNFWYMFPDTVRVVRPLFGRYGKLRETKTIQTALREVLQANGCGRCPETERLLTAYEAGRSR